MSKIYTLAELRQDHTPIQEVFFEAMMEGYANDVSPDSEELLLTGALTNTPRVTSVGFEYERDSWKVIDEYHVTSASDYSGGTTLIYHDNVLVWMMHYWGRYPEHLIPLLKTVLLESYKKQRFDGGRGPKQWDFSNEDRGLRYTNHIEDGRFVYFRGEETLGPTLELENDHNWGWHIYHGGLMI